jgi:ribosome biogenesis GTPase / thiamine phosphate phosphatase
MTVKAGTAYVSQAAPTGSQRLRALGWGEGHAKAFAILQEAVGADLIPALVTEAGGGGCSAESGTGSIRATYGSNLLLSMARDPLRRPLIDDWIAVRSWPDGRKTAEAILSRRVTLMRQGPGPAGSAGSVIPPAAEAHRATELPRPSTAAEHRRPPRRAGSDRNGLSERGPDF